MAMSVSAEGLGAKELTAAADARGLSGGSYACVLAYNAEAVIEEVVRVALGCCGNVLVCDDGSVDKTSDKAREAGAHVIRHKTRQGKKISMSELVNEVVFKSPSFLVLLDEEGLAHAEDLPAVLEPVLRDAADIAVTLGESGGTLDAGITAMDSIGLFTLYRGGFFSEAVASPQAAIAAIAGLRLKTVSPKAGEATPAKSRYTVLPPFAQPNETRPTIKRFLDRNFLALGVPALGLTGLGILLLAEFLITYGSTGQIPVSKGVMGVMGLISVVFGMFFMIAYYVAYAANHAFAKKE